MVPIPTNFTSLAVLAAPSWPQTTYRAPDPPEIIFVITSEAAIHRFYDSITPPEFGISNYSENVSTDKPGQGSMGWRHWKAFIGECEEIENRPAIALRFDLPRFYPPDRSNPRWRSGRWKAKA